MSIEIVGIDHIYLAVADMDQSVAFYDPVMQYLGFKKSAGPLAGGDVHVHYYNRVTQITIRPAHDTAQRFKREAPGLDHLCLQVANVDDVNTVAEGLGRLGVECTPPRFYPEYAADYYATFFSDPDGIRLEITNLRQERRDIVKHWGQLT